MTAHLTQTSDRVVVLGTARLTLADLVAVARHGARVELDAAVDERLRASQEWVEAAGLERPIYSINTGFGSLAGRQAFADPADAAELSRRLVLSNASGIGRYVDAELVRATMLIRAVSLLSGHSGVRPEVARLVVDMLNAGVHPAIPEYGSLGASGDLIPLAHLAVVMTRGVAGRESAEEDVRNSGEVLLDGRGGNRVVTGAQAMADAGLERIALAAKEGLALLNGTSFSCAQVALALHDAQNLLDTNLVTAAMSIEALKGFGDAFIAELHEARGQSGQVEVAARIRRLLTGATLVDGDRDHDPVRQPPQDAYSLRCVPQVLGPITDTLRFVAGLVENEMNAATDNPLIFPSLPRSLKAVSGGNFHAEYMAFAADFLAIAVTEIGNITERRLFRMDDGTLNRGLPDMLVNSAQVGMDCGYMLPQYLAAALVSDCKTLAHPDSVDSIPTCANQEDHVSMANNAGRHARQVVANIEAVVAIELLMAAQALDLRILQDEVTEDGLAPTSRAVRALVRGSEDAQGQPVAHLTQDRVLYPWLRKAVELVHSGAVVATAEGLS
ncbi:MULTISPECIES: histidine ammonia-lyase [unclassified Nocardioides]|uniref:HAL/PAL/TAL family ammonia-lyase n=1 Tax=unclassified Nocardioides TaxID=2615069 RepID=UPI001154705D|nr:MULTISPECIES: histidine ammonia-lyase [unclassified Nocardioides]TQK68408.1 histidine ammonia-lyase [Nocardioides sp. SLBN-35]WGY02279.1 histidine ammonia-lyase [Nocardioides sp. QY071]